MLSTKSRRPKLWYFFRRKLQVAFLVLLVFAFVPLIAFYNVTYEAILKITSDNALVQLEQINENFDRFLSSIDNISMSLISNRTLKESLNETDMLKQLEKARFVDSVLHSIFISNPTVLNLVIYDNNGVMYGVQGIISDPSLMQRIGSYIEPAKDARGKNLWLGMQWLHPALTNRQSAEELPAFPTIASFTDYYTKQSVGILIIELKASSIQQMLVQARGDADSHLFLLDAEHRVLLSSGADDAFGALGAVGGSQGNRIVRRDGKDYLLNYTTNGRTGWYLAKLVSVSSLMQASRRIRDIFLLLYAALAAFGVIYSLLITRSLTRDMSRITSVVQAVKRGNFDVSIHSQRIDEIGEISDEIDNLILYVKELIQNYYQQKTMAAEARFHSLQAQISPHFIYNSLDTINWKLIAMGQLELSDMLVALGDLLRYTVGTHDIVTLSRELAHVSNYLLVCSRSMSGRVHYAFDVQINADEICVPRLLLQPIVENAVKHGISELANGGRIDILIAAFDKRLIIEVANDGPAPDLEKIHGILADEARFRDVGIGLRNVQQRIHAIYGENCGLTFSVRNGRTVAVMTLMREMPLKGDGTHHD